VSEFSVAIVIVLYQVISLIFMLSEPQPGMQNIL